MKICVVGSGYVGLVTGACLADFGVEVTGVDIDPDKVARLSRGEIPIYEPGLEGLVGRNARAGRLEFTTELGPAVRGADAVFIAVGTPSRADGSADLTYVDQVADSIGEHLDGFTVVVTKSTVPTGTGERVAERIRRRAGSDADFAIVSNPEFLREGSAIEDFMHPDRVVIGSDDERAREVMLRIYSPLRAREVPFVVTDVKTAELIKYASNGFLATKISFINEVAWLCEALGADVEKVAQGMGSDARIGPQFLSAGPGFGGSCFPKDTRAVARIAREQGLAFRIIEAVEKVNREVKQRMVEKMDQAFGGLDGSTVAVLGLSFKPDTDDVRESPALDVVAGLLARGARVRAVDPAAGEPFAGELERYRGQPASEEEIRYFADPYGAAEGADGLVIVTDWNQFKALEFRRLSTLLKRPLLVDLRNLYQPDEVAAAGFTYVSVGRRDAVPASAPVGSPVP